MSKSGPFFSGYRSKNKIISVYEKKPESIYNIDLSASEADSEFSNNVTPKTERKNFSKVNCEINSVDISFLVDSGASVNIIIDIETVEKISKVCEIGLETTNSKIYTFGWKENLTQQLKTVIFKFIPGFLQ